MANKKLMERVLEEDFQHFGQLCRFCRENSDPPMSRSALSKILEYGNTQMYGYINAVERGQYLGSPALVKGVVELFDLDKGYVLALLAKQALFKYSKVLKHPLKQISVGNSSY